MEKHNRVRGIAGGLRVASAVALFCLTVSAGAQNIVANPNFATQLPPWSVFFSSAPDPVGSGSAVWISSEDADASPTSGSADVTLDAAPSLANAATGIDQCVSFASTLVTQVNYGTRFKLPASDVADGGVSATVEIRLFSDAACTQFIPGAGGFQARAIVAGVPDDGTWYSAGDPSFTPPSNTTAQSAQIRASLRMNAAPGAATIGYFDNIYLSLNGSMPVSLQSFDIK